ncbi:MAG: hypothetical protein ACLTEE_01940 [Anaerobutyricum hallii]
MLRPVGTDWIKIRYYRSDRGESPVKGLYGIKNVSQGVWRGFYPDGKLKDIPNGQGIPIWNGIVLSDLNWGEESESSLSGTADGGEKGKIEDEQTVLRTEYRCRHRIR